MDDINIQKDNLCFHNLMTNVDKSVNFTLLDVFNFIKRGEIPTDMLGCIIQCDYIAELMQEIESHPFLPDNLIDHLQLAWGMHKDEWGCNSSWTFDGAGKKEEMTEDVKQYFEQKGQDLPEGWVQRYAIEFTPLWKLSGYTIKICPFITFEDWTGENISAYKEVYINGTPDIKVIDLLYSIFWEISFCGHPDQRDAQFNYLQESVRDIKENKNTIEFKDWKECEEQIKKKFSTDA